MTLWLVRAPTEQQNQQLLCQTQVNITITTNKLILNEKDIQYKKNIIRKLIRKKRDKLTETEVKEKSRQIEKKLFDIQRVKEASIIMCYVSYAKEAATHSMIKHLIASGKKAAVPLVCKDRRKILISELRDFDKELAVGAYGILEPKKQYIRPLALEDIQVIIMPGLAFDITGGRLGYGGGYYDRLLEIKPNPYKIGLAYDFQLVDLLPLSLYDVKLDNIVTEQKNINCHKQTTF